MPGAEDEHEDEGRPGREGPRSTACRIVCLAASQRHICGPTDRGPIMDCHRYLWLPN